MSAHALIHTACKDLGIDEDTRRDLYERVTGKRSLTDMSPAEHERIVAELRAKGFKALSHRPDGRQKLTGKYAGKLQALWIAGYNLGLIRSRDDMALLAFIKKQTGIDHSRFLRDADDAARVIEALKGWLARGGGVDWNNASSIAPEFMKKPGYMIATAQWKKLGGVVRGSLEFIEAVFELVGPRNGIDAITDDDWIKVMNAFGVRVRAMKKGDVRSEKDEGKALPSPIRLLTSSINEGRQP
jgi:hypothetical protein